MAQKAGNRLLVVLGTLLVVPCLGAVYAWSVFQRPVQEHFGQLLGVDPATLTSQVALNFSIVILMFAISALIAGRLQDRMGPRWITTIGALLLGGGLILSSQATSILQLQIFYGVIAGAGLGFGYVCPMATCIKWFPDKKGMITGVAVGGMGAGALIFAPIASSLIESQGVMPTFAYLGVMFILLAGTGAQLLKPPPEGYRPPGWEPPAASSAGKGANDFTPGQMLSTVQFYLIWAMFLFGCAAALMIIGLASPIGQEVANLTVVQATLVVSILGMLNSVGRLFWGTVSDKLGRMRTLSVVFIICGSGLLLLMTANSFTLFAVSASMVALTFGGYMAVFPATTADFYGSKNLGANYGLVYLAYGFGAVLGMQLGAELLVTNINMAFLAGAVLCFIGAGMSFITKPPKYKWGTAKA